MKIHTLEIIESNRQGYSIRVQETMQARPGQTPEPGTTESLNGPVKRKASYPDLWGLIGLVCLICLLAGVIFWLMVL